MGGGGANVLESFSFFFLPFSPPPTSRRDKKRKYVLFPIFIHMDKVKSKVCAMTKSISNEDSLSFEEDILLFSFSFSLLSFLPLFSTTLVIINENKFSFGKSNRSTVIVHVLEVKE